MSDGLKRTVLALALTMTMTPAMATGWHKIPMMVKPPVVVVPPPVVTPPPTASAAPATSSASGTPWLGIGAMAFTLVFFYLAICQLEEERDPEQFKALHCPSPPDPEVFKTCNPFSQAPCQ